ncbi:MAG: FAD:protein FMN transferase [Actinomycetota bacterium]
MEEQIRHHFRAMGTDVAVYLPSSAGTVFAAASAIVEEVFAREERRFSRFRADSELSRVNGRSGRWTEVSEPFEALVRFALARAEATDGSFDPSALDAVIAAGYDRDFDEILAGARGALRPPRPCGRWRQIEIRDGSVRLPRDVGLDLGGVAKGWTVDVAVDAALCAGLPWVLVSAGGDLRIAGDAPILDVAIEDPGVTSEAAGWLQLATGALASSSTMRRAWGPGLHHIIDPRTGAPARTPVVQATVWAPTCAEAEVLATWALLKGTDAIDAVPCALVTEEGDLIVNFAVDEDAA